MGRVFVGGIVQLGGFRLHRIGHSMTREQPVPSGRPDRQYMAVVTFLAITLSAAGSFYLVLTSPCPLAGERNQGFRS